ncbi:hypothetical protein UF75_1898 [Desulfosporosinus sp. I2]|nr:hypothetical protein UF75_1898 [Desulfosporosinus sp. I2]
MISSNIFFFLFLMEFLGFNFAFLEIIPSQGELYAKPKGLFEISH